MPINYPLDLRFRIVTISTRIDVRDATGSQVMFVKKKKFRLKEDVDVWRDEARTDRAYRLQADRIIDFSASYAITGSAGEPLGAVRRRGGRSIWRASYELLDADGTVIGEIHEENPWLKVLDSILGNIPFLSMFINPAYRVTLRGRDALRVKKEPAFFEGRFSVNALDKLQDAEENVAIPGILMMILLERERG